MLLDCICRAKLTRDDGLDKGLELASGVQPLQPLQNVRLFSTLHSLKQINVQYRRLETKEGEIEAHPLTGASNLSERLSQLVTKQALQAQSKALQREVKATQGTVLQSELKSRMRVLRRLGWVPF